MWVEWIVLQTWKIFLKIFWKEKVFFQNKICYPEELLLASQLSLHSPCCLFPGNVFCLFVCWSNVQQQKEKNLTVFSMGMIFVCCSKVQEQRNKKKLQNIAAFSLVGMIVCLFVCLSKVREQRNKKNLQKLTVFSLSSSLLSASLSLESWVSASAS